MDDVVSPGGVLRHAAALTTRALRPGRAVSLYAQNRPLQGAVQSHRAKFPRPVRSVDDLPKTSTGKVMRRELIKRFTS
ncbi:hypothetical protein [Saccharothrix deserti]|uniref:hypothetical protein n=1 Tax=Saccharothrix deserti TaxID=2593674 RepID=UPI00131BB05E|nr:hypothetical protein [Saccharothrix deserti]